MVGVILTLVAIGLVSYFVIKNYYPPIILLLLGLLLLFCAYLEGVPAVAPKASTNFFAFDFAQAFTNLLKGPPLARLRSQHYGDCRLCCLYGPYRRQQSIG